MGVIAELKLLHRLNESRALADRTHTYVIAPRHRMTHTMELVEHVGRYPLVTIEGGEPCAPATYAEVEASIIAGKMAINDIQIRYAEPDELCMPIKPFSLDNGYRGDTGYRGDQIKARFTDPTPPCVLALQSVVEANARYVELTGRPQEAVALHPAHARELLDLILNK